MMYRVTNISRNQSHGGQFLQMGPEFSNTLLPAGRSCQGDVTVLPQYLLNWKEQGLVQIVNAQTGVDAAPAPSAQLTPGQLSPFKEMPGIDPEGTDEFDDQEPDLSMAVEATLPPLPGVGPAALGVAKHARAPGPGEVEGAHMPERPGRPAIAPHPSYNRANISQGNVKVDTARADASNELSPIPGETPRSLDNSAAFTIRAPRYQGPGKVISSKG